MLTRAQRSHAAALGHYSHVWGDLAPIVLALSWASALAMCIGLGAPGARLFLRAESISWIFIRVSLWFGTGLVCLVVLAMSLVVPLGGRIATTALAGCGVLGVIGCLWIVRSWRGRVASPGLAGWILLSILLLGCMILAWWASGEPSNYDTGLYHLGAISYAGEFPVIPGLANLHERFGFNSSMWPVAAVVDVGLLDGQGFRFVNGLLCWALVIDLCLRLVDRRSRTSPATYALTASTVLVLGAVAQYPGRLIASPAQDTALTVLTLVSAAYLLDFVVQASSSAAHGSIAVTVGLIGGTIRPLGWVFAGGVIAVVALLSLRDPERRWTRAQAWTVAVFAVGLVGVMLVRDALLSGWLLYPLSWFAVPVDWQVVDPGHAARDISGWARTPFQDVDLTLQDSTWIWGWLVRLPTDWSIPALLLLLGSTAVAAFTPGARRALRAGWPSVLVTMSPALVTLAVWFVTAPDPRFAWGPLLAVGVIPLGVALTGMDLPSVTALCFTTIFLALLVLAFLRGSFQAMSNQFVDPPPVLVEQERLSDGTSVQVPVVGDQCWSTYPLCTPWYADRTVRVRGSDIGSGFRPDRAFHGD